MERELRTEYDSKVGLRDEVEAAERGEDLHIEWPERAELKLERLSARYRPELPLILHEVTISAAPGERVGIVGRTGAGKSSIIQALYRIFEPELGTEYKLDGYDALKLGLHSLRQHISVIPQTPFLFKGTVSQNVDPFGSASEEQVWNALDRAGLGPRVRKVFIFRLSYQTAWRRRCPTTVRPFQ